MAVHVCACVGGSEGFILEIFEVAAAHSQGTRRELWCSEQVHRPLKVIWVSLDVWSSKSSLPGTAYSFMASSPSDSFFLFLFLGLHPWHIDVPRLGD